MNIYMNKDGVHLGIIFVWFIDQRHVLIELLFVFVEAVFVGPRSEELGIAT